MSMIDEVRAQMMEAMKNKNKDRKDALSILSEKNIFVNLFSCYSLIFFRTLANKGGKAVASSFGVVLALLPTENLLYIISQAFLPQFYLRDFRPPCPSLWA